MRIRSIVFVDIKSSKTGPLTAAKVVVLVGIHYSILERIVLVRPSLGT